MGDLSLIELCSDKLVIFQLAHLSNIYSYLFKMRACFLGTLLFLTGTLAAPQGQYSAPQCTTQRFQEAINYNCKADQECQTSYEQKCDTTYENVCETKYEQQCQTEYENKCETRYENQCQTSYEDGVKLSMNNSVVPS